VTARGPAKGATLAGAYVEHVAMNRRTLKSLMYTGVEVIATLVLVDLRLAGVITWPWWWVIAPLWLPVAIIGLAFAGLAARDRLG
jgi:hypothetical protein